MKEQILKEFDKLIGDAPEMVKMSEVVGENVCFVCGQPFNKSTQVEGLRNLFIKAIAKTREETIKEIENNIKLKPTGYLLMSGNVSEDEINGYEKSRQEVLKILNKLKK